MAVENSTPIGSRFSKLTVISEPFKDKFYISKVRCRCDCGNESIASCRQLNIGQTKSCGCMRAETGKSKRIDIPIGAIFGQLTVIGPDVVGDGARRKIMCLCKCGSQSLVAIHDLRSRTKSCGCLVSSVNRSNNPIPVGKRFGNAVVIDEAERIGRDRRVRARCDCGNEFVTALNNLRTGHTKSCGCERVNANISNTKHGYARKGAVSRTYAIYRDMRTRCENPNYKEFYLYGGRGILVCDQWKSFENFLADMGNPPEGMSIDRVDVNGQYSLENCRWATDATQSNNKRNNVVLDFQGKSMTVAQWARELKIKPSRIYYRVSKGLSAEEALAD